jgi:hypothetical protein
LKEVITKHRRGKILHPPRERMLATDGSAVLAPLLEGPVDPTWAEEKYDYSATMETESRFGRYGKCSVLRYSPCASSTNPVGQCCLRCNFDVQCMDRVFPLPAEWAASALSASASTAVVATLAAESDPGAGSQDTVLVHAFCLHLATCSRF